MLIASMRYIILYETKVKLLNDVLLNTESGMPIIQLLLNRRSSITHIPNEADLDPSDISNSISTHSPQRDSILFLQAWNQLKSIDPSRLKQAKQAWEVKFDKEGAMDVGGPYSESLSQFCIDITLPELGLLIPCPNKVAGTGYNQDKYVPNPSAEDSEQVTLTYIYIYLL